jgi:hypothetical protein
MKSAEGTPSRALSALFTPRLKKRSEPILNLAVPESLHESLHDASPAAGPPRGGFLLRRRRA